MARPHRVCPPGLTLHVVQRGNNRGAVFQDGSDCRFFLWLLGREAARHAVAVHAYALMGNHFHLMATPTDPLGVSKMMQGIGRLYVPLINSKYRRTGGLWEGRFRSFPIEDENYWLTCMRYVELNPVRAGLVRSPEEYRWSSARAHLTGQFDTMLAPHPLYLGLGTTPDDRQQAWRTMCRVLASDHELAEIRHAVRTGRLGALPADSTQGQTP